MFRVQRLSVRLASHVAGTRGSVRLWTGVEAVVRDHDQKIKDMSQSVLPSTRRRSARDNGRTIHMQQRAASLPLSPLTTGMVSRTA